jgi:hypothetical protein
MNMRHLLKNSEKTGRLYRYMVFITFYPLLGPFPALRALLFATYLSSINSPLLNKKGKKKDITNIWKT